MTSIVFLLCTIAATTGLIVGAAIGFLLRDIKQDREYMN